MATAPARSFVPADFDPADWPSIEAVLQQLLDRPLDSPDQLRQWLLDYSELERAVDDNASWRFVLHTCQTDDEQREKDYLHIIENIVPKLKPYDFKLKQKFFACTHKDALSEPAFEMLNKHWSRQVELFRDENVPLETELAKMESAYDKLIGGIVVSFRGEEYALPQIGKFLKSPDRATRKEAWDAKEEALLAKRGELDELFNKMLKLRQQVAQNAGYANYRDYLFATPRRFDYDPAACEAFAAAVEAEVVPLVRDLNATKAEAMGLDPLKPWDMAADSKGREPLRPFDEDGIADWVATTQRVFESLDPELASQFAELKLGETLDLDSRKGKAPGGYQCSLPERRKPFIFMNATGLSGDVRTLLHEAGHAFHFMFTRDIEPVFVHHAPIEFCEVASMSMELLALPQYDRFYPELSDRQRALREQLEGIIRVLPWIVTVDQFQQWIYTNPKHTVDERTAYWISLGERFGFGRGMGHGVDWSDCIESRDAYWHRQLHIFTHPFYYVEYGIAQLGALQVWLNSLKDRVEALKQYKHGLALGGTRPLPELFEAAGAKFDFSQPTIAPLMQAVRSELEKLPA